MDWVESYRGVVYPYQLDHMGHMNVMWYTSKFDEATWHFFAQIGITPKYLKEENRGMFAVKQITNYKKEALVGELIKIESKTIKLSEKKIQFIHRMINCETQEEMATTEIIGVHIDKSIRKSCPFPEFIFNSNK